MFDSVASSGGEPSGAAPPGVEAGASPPARPPERPAIRLPARLGVSARWAAATVGGIRRLVRTHAFRLAALYFLVFALSVTGVLFFVYWATADFIERQTEATLSAEVTGLAEQYAQRGLSGLVQIVAARSAGDRGDGMLYLVTNPDGRPLAGNISGWPAGAPVRPGPLAFEIDVPGQVDMSG